MMTTNRIPEALFPVFGRDNGYGWGLGFCIAVIRRCSAIP